MAYTKILAVPIQTNAGGTKYYAKITVTLNGTSITKVAASGVYSNAALATAAGTVKSFSGGSASTGKGTWTNGNSGAFGSPLYRFTVASAAVSNYTLAVTVSSTYHQQTSSSGTSTNYTNNAPQTLTAAIGHWSVTYDPGEHGSGAAASQVKIESTALTLKGAVYTREGHTQTGWSTTDGGAQTHALGASYTTDADLTLYPVFTPRSYAVTLNANGGTVGAGNITSYTYGVGAQLPASVTRAGFTFGGWYASSDLSGAPVAAIAADETGDKSYWAKWIGRSYTVTLNLDGGTLPPLAGVTSYTAGTATRLPESATKLGHTFRGWYASADLSGTPVAAIAADEIGDKSYWAKWSVNSYAVTLQTNGGTINEGDVVAYTYGNGARLPTDVTREGYAFGGWYASGDFSGDRVSEIPASSTGAKAYYAKWTAAHEVIFVGHDGTVLKTQTVLDGDDATPPEPPARTGYAFAGWIGDYLGVTADTTVTATYDLLSYTVTFVDYDGTVLKTQTVDHGGAATAPEDPAHEGYAFAGWSVDFANVTGPLTVTAVYAGEANYRVRARRYQRLYAASRLTPAYAASVEASRIAATLCTVPWTEAAGVHESCLPAHSGTSDEADAANVSARASFDAAIFCADHAQGQHRAYAQATCYRFALPESARGKRLNTLSLVAAGDPYLRDGARISILTNDTGVIPMDCATCRSGDYHVAGVCRRTVSADGQRWFGTSERLTLIPPDGITLGSFLFLFVMLEDYSYSRQEYLEGAVCIQPDVYLGLDGTVAGWSQTDINFCYEDAGHAYTVTRGGTLAANTAAETGAWSITLQANGDGLDAPACAAAASDAALGLRAVYAALFTQTLQVVPADALGNDGRRIGAGFAVCRTSATVGSTSVTAWHLAMSALLIKTSLPTSWRASTLVLDWSAWQGQATPGARYNVWIRRGSYADNYGQEITKPVLWDASANAESGFELVGVIDATAADRHAELRLNRPLDGYVATILLTAYAPLDDDSPLAAAWTQAGAPQDLHLPSDGTAAGLTHTWIPDIILKG